MDLAKPDASFPALDASQVLVKPDDEIPKEHHVVVRIHGGISCIPVPQFPDGGGSVFYHVAPAWVIAVGSYGIRYIAATVVSQSAHKPLNPYQTGTHVAIKLIHRFIYNILEHPFLETFRNQPESQRQ